MRHVPHAHHPSHHPLLSLLPRAIAHLQAIAAATNERRNQGRWAWYGLDAASYARASDEVRRRDGSAAGHPSGQPWVRRVTLGAAGHPGCGGSPWVRRVTLGAVAPVCRYVRLCLFEYVVVAVVRLSRDLGES